MKIKNKNTKRFLLAILVLLITITNGTAQNVAINDDGSNPNRNAILDVDISTNDKGILIPRLTQAQRIAMNLEACDLGLMVFQSDQDTGFWYWNGIVWKTVLSSENVCAHGEMYLYDQFLPIEITELSTWYKIIDWTGGETMNVTYAEDSLTTQNSGNYLVTFSLSAIADPKDNYEFAIGLNGTRVKKSEIESRIQDNESKASAIAGSCILYLTTDDVITMLVKSDNKTGNIEVTHANISMVKL